MTPERIARILPGVGRVRFRLGTGNAAHRRQRIAVVDALMDGGQVGTLLGLRDGIFTWRELLAAHREGRLLESADLLALRAPLWITADRLFTSDDPTTRKYRASLRVLRSLPVPALRGEPAVSQLARVDWIGLYRDWDRSPAHWNHLRRAVSRLCTLATYKGHPFWAKLRHRYPIAREVPRMVDVGLEDLARLRGALPDWAWGAVILMAVGGLRVGEVLRLEGRDLAGYQVRVRQAKTPAGRRVVPVPESLWPAVVRAVPMPVRYEGWRAVWGKARQAAGLPHLRTHDLRHVAVQVWLEAGWDVAHVQRLMGHRFSRQTLDYAGRLRMAERVRGLAPDVGSLTDVPAPSPTPSPAGRYEGT